MTMGASRTSDRDALALAAGEGGSPLADNRVVALGQAVDELVDEGRLRSREDVGLGRLRATVDDVLENAPLEQDRLLGHDRDLRSQGAKLERPHVDAVDGDLSPLRIEEPRHQA